MKIWCPLLNSRQKQVAKTYSRIFESTEETQKWAHEFALTLKKGMVIGLHGEMGAGKTFFCRALCEALGFLGDVHSPSYTLVNEYPGQLPIYHIDFFRLNENADWEEIGVSYYLGSKDALVLVEWPEKCPQAKDYISIDIFIEIISPTTRRFLIASSV